MPVPATSAPDPLYYLANFAQAMTWVAARYHDLHDAPTRAFFTAFHALPQPSRALLVRLLMRKGPWFRASRLVYPEIGCIQQAAHPLITLGWLDDAPLLSADHLVALHTLPELRTAFATLPGLAALRKSDVSARIAAAFPAPQRYADWMPHTPDTVLHVTVDTLCDRLRLMFFGNLRQTWSEFVLADLGVFQYEPVAFSAASRAFGSQAEIDAWLALHACRVALDDPEADLDDLFAQAQAVACPTDWLAMRRSRLLLRVGQACERRQHWPGALQAYAHSHYPGARHRRVRVLERSGQCHEALTLARTALQTPESEEEQQRVGRMLPRLHRGAGQPPLPRTPPAEPSRWDLVLPRPTQPQSVEYVVRDHLHQADAPVHYVENGLINSLFGLLCWDAVFAPLPGAFFHPFQDAPADLHAPDFAQRRAQAFEDCLRLLDTDAYLDVIRQRFCDKAGVQSPFVFWGLLTPELLELALACLPPAHLKHWFTRLLHNVPANRTGLPDLIRFYPARRDYELIEVKGPGDRLQDNQRRWLAYCVTHQMPVHVCYVQWADEAA